MKTVTVTTTLHFFQEDDATGTEEFNVPDPGAITLGEGFLMLYLSDGREVYLSTEDIVRIDVR